jgi:nitroreductase
MANCARLERAARSGGQLEPHVFAASEVDMDAYEAILARRSIRAYQDRPLERALLVKLLEAAMAAPTACNAQPWEFVVIVDEEGLARMRTLLPFGKYNAPAAIVVCGSMEKALNNCAERYWVQDCSAALENILVAAAGMGLGTVWMGVYPIEERVQAVRAALDLPATVTPLGVVYAGYPGETKEPRTQYEEGRVHWGMYPKG